MSIQPGMIYFNSKKSLPTKADFSLCWTVYYKTRSDTFFMSSERKTCVVTYILTIGIWNNLCTQNGTYCNASSTKNGNYSCDTAIDGFVSHGMNNEWHSKQGAAGAWIKVSIIR